jgi:acetyl esterase/lipase
VEKDRADLLAMARLFRPLGKVECRPIDAAGVRAEWILPAGRLQRRTLLYFHGGSFNAGSTNPSAWPQPAPAPGRTLIIEYRLATPFPAALQVARLLKWCWRTQPGEIIAAIWRAAAWFSSADRRAIAAAAASLGDPATDLTLNGATIKSNAAADLVLEEHNLHQSVEIYMRTADLRTPLASPLFADLRGLPPLLVQVGSDEMLLSDSTAFAERAKVAGLELALEIWPGMQHVWHFAASFVPEGRKAISAWRAVVHHQRVSSKVHRALDH